MKMKGEVNGRVAIEKKLEGKGYSIEEFKRGVKKKQSFLGKRRAGN